MPFRSVPPGGASAGSATNLLLNTLISLFPAIIQGGVEIFRNLRPAEVPNEALRKDPRFADLERTIERQHDVIEGLHQQYVEMQKVAEQNAAQAARSAQLLRDLEEAEERKRLQEEALENRRRELVKKIYDAARKAGLDPEKFNLAFGGQAGTGKSSLMNAVVGKKVSETNIIECTQNPISYPDPTYPFLIMWDIPGAATLNHPMASYYPENFLYLMDLMVIVIRERLTENDIELLRTAIDYGQTALIVRSKADNDVESQIRKDKESVRFRYDKLSSQEQDHYRKKVLQIVTGEVKAQLKKQGLGDIQFYYVSSTVIEELNEAKKAGGKVDDRATADEPLMYPRMDEDQFMHDLFRGLKKRSTVHLEDFVFKESDRFFNAQPTQTANEAA